MRIKLTIAALAFTAIANAQQRQMLTLTEGWQFSRDNASWKSVNIPHDWAIAGPFDKKWDLQYVAIEQNGEKEKSEKSGRSGALPWIGEGHYRTSVTLPQGLRKDTKNVFLFNGGDVVGEEVIEEIKSIKLPLLAKGFIVSLNEDKIYESL